MRFIAAINTRIYGRYYAQGGEIDTLGWSRKQMLQFLNLGLIQASQITAGMITDAIVFEGAGVTTTTNADGQLVVIIEEVPLALGDLTDVEVLEGLTADGAVLAFDWESSQWKPTALGELTSPIYLHDLVDVGEMFAEDGNVLLFDAGIGLWQPGVMATTMAALEDVDVSGIADGQTVIWDNSEEMFVPGTPLGAPGPPGPAAWATPVPWTSSLNAVIGPPATVVTYAGSSYVAIAPSTNQSPTNIAYWRLIASKGAQGDKGDPGPASTIPGPPGVGVPTGGATGTVLTKTSGTDYATAWQAAAAGYTDEQVRDVVGGALVAGTNMTVTVNDVANTITLDAAGGGGGSSGPGLWRGAWSTLSLDATLDLYPVPGGLTVTNIAGTTPSGGIAATGTGNPGGTVLRLGSAGPGGFSTDLAKAEITVPPGIVKMRVYAAVEGGFWGNACRILNDGVNVWNTVIGWGWIELTVAAGDVMTFENYLTGNGNSGTWLLDRLEWLAPVDPPYSTGEYVTHLNRIWVSDADNNSGVPGTAGWTRWDPAVDTNDIPDLLEVTQDAVAAMITAGSGITKTYNDSLGTLTLDATGGGGGGTGLFRGEWSSLQVITDATLVNAAAVTALGASVSGNTSFTTTPGGVAPPGQGTVLGIGNNTALGQLLLTIPTGVTKVRWYAKVDDNFWDTPQEVRYPNTSTIAQTKLTTDWYTGELAVTAGNQISWNSQAGGGSWGTWWIATVELLGPNANPYMAGEYVTYAGRLWRSLSDNNSGTPGTAGWIEAQWTIDAADIPDLVEATQDTVGAMVAAAGGSYNDSAGTITLPAGGLDLEAVQDAVAAMITDTATVTKAYNDTTGTLELTAAGGGGGGYDTVMDDGDSLASRNTLDFGGVELTVFDVSDVVPADVGVMLCVLDSASLGTAASNIDTWADETANGVDAIWPGILGRPTVAAGATPTGMKAANFAANQILGLPRMSTRTPFYMAAADSTSTGVPLNVIDNIPANLWHSATTAWPHWVRLELATPAALTALRLTAPASNFTRMPKDFTIEATNDPTFAAWTTLDTRTGITWTASQQQVFSFTNATVYRWYRVVGTANNVPSTQMTINEIAVDGTPNGYTDAEFWLVVKAAGSATSGLWTMGGSGVSSHYPYSNGHVYDDAGSDTRTELTPDWVLTDWHILHVSMVGTAWIFRVDNVVKTNVAKAKGAPGGSLTGAYALGEGDGSQDFLGQVAFFAMSRGAMTTDERDGMYAYLYSRYISDLDLAGGPRTKVLHTPKVIAEEGTALPWRPTLDFVGAVAAVTDDAVGNKTKVTLTTRFPATFSDNRAPLTVGAGTMKWPNTTGRTLSILSVRVDLATAPTTGTFIVDVNKNATTIFTTQANRPIVAIGASMATSGTPNVTTLADGEYLTVDIDDVNGANGLVVTIALEG